MSSQRQQSETITIQSPAYEVLERVVKARGTSGGVYLPVSWTGKRVKILLLDPVEKRSECKRGQVNMTERLRLTGLPCYRSLIPSIDRNTITA